MKAGRAKIDIFQKMRIKNLRKRGVSEVRLKKLDSFTLETSKNHFIRNFLRNGRVRVKPFMTMIGEIGPIIFLIKCNPDIFQHFLPAIFSKNLSSRYF